LYCKAKLCAAKLTRFAAQSQERRAGTAPGMRINGRNRHITVDVPGMLLTVEAQSRTPLSEPSAWP